jgi:hypothetical protein
MRCGVSRLESEGFPLLPGRFFFLLGKKLVPFNYCQHGVTEKHGGARRCLFINCGTA